MTAPMRSRKPAAPFPPQQAEALGLSFQTGDSPPSAVPRRGSQIKIPSMQGIPIPPPQSQSQSSLPQQPSSLQRFYAAPPSPSHTAQSLSPPTTTISPSGFSNHSSMSNPTQSSSFPRQQMRVPPPVHDPWVPETDTLVDTQEDRTVDHRPRPPSGTLIEPARTSPIPTNGSRSNVQTRPRPRPTNSSPVQTSSAIRQQPYTAVQPQQAPTQTQFPPQPIRMSSQPAHALPTISSSQSIGNRAGPLDNTSRALLTPPNSIHKGMEDHQDDAPARNTISPHYHAPYEPRTDRTESSGNEPSPTSTHDYSRPFQYDADTMTEYTTEHEVDISDVEPRVATVQEPPQVQKATLQTAPAASRVPIRLPFREEAEEAELDDLTPSGLLPHQQEPMRWNTVGQSQQPQLQPQQQQPQQQQKPHKRHSTSPPPASPSPHPPIPILAPQSVSVAHPPLLGQRRPSPPAAPQSTLLVNNNQNISHDHDEPAEASSDNFTPKSPNAPLPVQDDYGYGRYGYGYGLGYGRPAPLDPFNQHYNFAMQMGGLAPPRGPTHVPPTFTSLGGAAASLADTPPNNPPAKNSAIPNGTTTNTNATANMNNNNNSVNNVNTNGTTFDPWDEYVDFYNHQQRNLGLRPSAPVPPTPQSAQPSHTPALNAAHGMPFEPPLIPERYIPSALSSYLSSPMMHNPFLQRLPPPPSIVSSPSHQPLDLTFGPMNTRRNGKQLLKNKKRTKSKLSSPPIAPPPAQPLPPRVESTIPKDTSSENDTDTDDDSGRTQRRPKDVTRHGEDSDDDEDTEDEDVWLSESSEDELDSEFHSRYILNPSKRKRKWEQKWEAMIRLFQELDRTTDSPMVLLAAPSSSSTPKTHILVSRAITRDPGKYMAHAQTCRIAFSKITKARRKAKQEQANLEKIRKAQGFEQQLAQLSLMNNRFDDLSTGSGGSPRGSVGSGLGALSDLRDLPQLASKGEEGLKTALSMALESMKQMQVIYEQREERRREEFERQRQESAGLEYLLRFVQQSGRDGQPMSDKSNTGSPQIVPPKSKSP